MWNPLVNYHIVGWNIPIFNRTYIFIHVHFPASYVSLPECNIFVGRFCWNFLLDVFFCFFFVCPLFSISFWFRISLNILVGQLNNCFFLLVVFFIELRLFSWILTVLATSAKNSGFGVAVSDPKVYKPEIYGLVSKTPSKQMTFPKKNTGGFFDIGHLLMIEIQGSFSMFFLGWEVTTKLQAQQGWLEGKRLVL